MRIGDFVRPESVVVGLQARDTREAVAALLAGLMVEGPLRAELEAALVQREEAHTTALPVGVAVPHTTLRGLDRPVIAIGTAREPVPFGNVPVRVVLLLLSPPEQGALHVKVLARVARLARRPGFIDALLAAGNTGELLSALERAEHDH